MRRAVVLRRQLGVQAQGRHLRGEAPATARAAELRAQSKVLWQVYFRLELKVAADVRARNEALGLPAVAEGANPGAVAEAVFEAARRAHPRDRVFPTRSS